MRPSRPSRGVAAAPSRPSRRPRRPPRARGAPKADRPLTFHGEPGSDVDQDRGREVRDDRGSRGGRFLSEFTRRSSTSTSFAFAFPRAASSAGSSGSTPVTRAKPSFRGDDRQHGGPVPRSASRPRVRDPRAGRAAPRTSASSRCAGPERLTGVDLDVHHVAGRRVAPGGPDHDPPAGDGRRLVEVPPAVGPVVGDRLGAHLRLALAGDRLHVPEVGKLSLGAVDRVLRNPGRPPPRPRRAQGAAAPRGPPRLLRAAADREPDPARRAARQLLGRGAARTTRRSGLTTSRTTCWSPRRRP